MRWRDLAELVRLPAALTVPGDTLVGAAAAGWPSGRRTAALPVASAALYWAGMALNDWSDRELDAVERPERPVPSGRVAPNEALGTAAALTGVGLAFAAVAGRRPLAVGTALAAAVWTYDLVAKPTAAGPVVMASTRFLDVLMGAGGRRAALAPAAALGVHTLAVTAVSRGEVHGTTVGTARAAVAATVGTGTAAALGALVGARRDTGSGAATSVAGPALAATYVAAVLPAQADVVRAPDAGNARRATGVGIRGMVPLQAALLAGQGAVGAALALLAVVPLARAGARVVSPT
ncbi:4-hydroxybenzoate polyprenyltransferase [Isoptericola sp. CG 20/1183]|uniref:4-hydroxybenzoate polyprenyltransferase n=1 Tax=Isoptericola halotolerans TaxID=300560 RepID=A0ABX5EHK2_9MICO|nr:MULTISPECIES: UbiA family prenyltransferase [Isoptericola]PRZ02491.1 4-hydroxybenzoate polyprenyltransferase [Isoptericola sp. CG 20/1183]PRZ04220.1 4-hydroxybenzoate polyprenyltransferase [Isoptericola sp. CG 20/1183]PRZ09955.1 4-hydroxybenzoate polyprenyltransferase [Isoptericola halotolerans]